ncbi:UbiA family prenyltransferase [Streptomyces typhae]|nr:UbiA family prenyltransferase [Streptomyces typhae]
MNLRAWAELLRLPALFTVPGDALAGAAATGLRPGRGTLLAIGSSLCLYEAGMALNDWADRAEDAVDRPQRPIPSGRVTPAAALTAAVALTAGGLALAARAGRPALATATALAGTVWAYDLGLKHTPAGPATMAAARGLDLLLGAVATNTTTRTPPRPSKPAPTSAPPSTAPHPSQPPQPGPHPPRTDLRSPQPGPHPPQPGPDRLLPPSTAVHGTGAYSTGTHSTGTHSTSARSTGTHSTSARSTDAHSSGALRHTAAAAARAALPAAATLAAHTLAVTAVSRNETQGGSTRAPLGALVTTLALGRAVASAPWPPADRRTVSAAVLPGTTVALTTAYAGTAARPYLHATLNPSPPLTQRAVGGGIRALIPLQAALAARSGSLGAALVTAALAPAARRFARKVSVT